jgi:hypothetical protein
MALIDVYNTCGQNIVSIRSWWLPRLHMWNNESIVSVVYNSLSFRIEPAILSFYHALTIIATISIIHHF